MVNGSSEDKILWIPRLVGAGVQVMILFPASE